MSTSNDLSRILQSFRFAGRATGAVKTLRGFKKSHHSVPDAVNAATTAFLGKLCADELAEEGESFFQRSRSLLKYTRKDLSLDTGIGTAVLSAKDFVLEIAYALNADEPSEYVVERSLHTLRTADFLYTAECDDLFAGLFREVVFLLTKGAPVEAVIDAIEGLRDDTLRVDFPSDYAHCMLTVSGVNASVRFDGRELTMQFPRAGAPRELWENFLLLRNAFALSKDEVLAALTGGT
jgi:hypothetical protein